jgi:uncharacterized protein YqjF (DUF2071 family)
MMMTEDVPQAVDRLSIRMRPAGGPLMRQWWGKLLFMHWPIDAKLLRPLVPNRLTIDTFEGVAWIGIVPFTMWGVRPTFTPPVPGLSAFHELNVRTYVHYKGVPGVWFFSLDAESALAVWAARNFVYLPYFNARMSLEQQYKTIIYSSTRTHKQAPPAIFNATWNIGEALEVSEPESLAFFLTERYCLYAARKEKLYRLRIFHPVWPLRKATLSTFNSTMIESLGIRTPEGEPLLHYAEELKVDIWPLVKV